MPAPLLLLPGLLNTRRLWESQIADISDIAAVTVPELWRHDSIGAMAEAALKAAPERFALGGFSMGGYVAFEILRRAPERVERLALMDTQATPDTAEATARRRGFVDQTKMGRFHGVQPSLLPQIVHRSRLADQSVIQPIVEMAADISHSQLVVIEQSGHMTPLEKPAEVAAALRRWLTQ